uniref:Sulfotransferase domain-containing protein n=1 Tax=viral metagenome TaxID=1070528 RepID=A0A6C0HZN7_9ZZZZ
MYDQFICLSGLPRSGSTLLSAILCQNPKIHAEGNSAVCQLMWDMQQSYVKKCNEQINANNRQQTIIDLISEIPRIYYKDIEETEKIIVDKCRSWTIPDNIQLLQNYIDKDFKIIVLERSIVDIVKSFCKLYEKNNVVYDLNRIFDPNSEPIIRSINGLIYAKQNNQNNNFLFIKYDELIENTENIIRKIYEFCNWEHFDHDFTNINQKYREDDSVYKLMGFHDVDNIIKKKENLVILPTEIINNCIQIDEIISSFEK